jgi:hypothetical protein
MGVGGLRHAAAALSPRKTRYQLNRRLGRTQVRYGRLREITPPPRFDTQTVQPIASRSEWFALVYHMHLDSRILVGKPKVRGQLVRPRRRRQDNIKINEIV